LGGGRQVERHKTHSFREGGEPVKGCIIQRRYI
jgi:hypothetical protein